MEKVASEARDNIAKYYELREVGKFYSRRGRFDRARDNYEAALLISRQIGDRKKEADAHKRIGTISEYLKQYDYAKLNHEAAFQITREIGYRKGEAECLVNIGKIFKRFGQLDDAKKTKQNKTKFLVGLTVPYT